MKFYSRIIIAIFLLILIQQACKKKVEPIPVNVCAAKVIAISETIQNATSGANGSITVNVSGTSNIQYQLNAGAFQSSNVFNNLAAASYIINIKDGDGCTATKTVSLVLSNPCTGVNINSTTSNLSATSGCGATDGNVTISSTGGTAPYVFSKDGINFQTIGTFTNLAQGNITFTTKDANGCIGTKVVAIPGATNGPLFTAVKQVMSSNCIGCHNGPGANAGLDLSIDCNIVANKTKINNRAVLGTPSPMPQSGLMPVSERNKITAWINAGGTLTN